MQFKPLAAAIAIGLAFPGIAAHADSPTVAPGDTLLTVTTDGNADRAPDIANFTAGLSTIGASASTALAASAAAMSRVIDALKRAGVADRDIQTSTLSLSPVYDPMNRNNGSTPRITGYQATNAITVRARALSETGRLIDTLVGAGANEISGPEFTLDHPEAALDEARTAAMANARARAALYAQVAGLKVLRILSISENQGYSPRPVMMMARMAAAQEKPPSPVEAGEVSSRITLTVEFELAPQ